MNSKLRIAQDSFIEAVGQISSSAGLNRVAGQLYALLFLSPEPLSLDEMVERLRISKGHVSTNIRVLEEWGAARKIWMKGERRDFYQADPNVMKVIVNRLQVGLRRRMQDALEAIEKVENKVQEVEGGLERNEKEVVKLWKQRLQKVKKIPKLVDRLLGVISKMIP